MTMMMMIMRMKTICDVQNVKVVMMMYIELVTAQSNSEKKAKYLKIIILRAQFALIYSTLVVSLKYMLSLQQRTFFPSPTKCRFPGKRSKSFSNGPNLV